MTISYQNGNWITAWMFPPLNAIRVISILLGENDDEGDDAMNMEFELSEIINSTEFDTSSSSITRKLVMQYMSAGILFPDEVRYAEQILRHLYTKT